MRKPYTILHVKLMTRAATGMTSKFLQIGHIRLWENNKNSVLDRIEPDETVSPVI